MLFSCLNMSQSINQAIWRKTTVWTYIMQHICVLRHNTRTIFTIIQGDPNVCFTLLQTKGLRDLQGEKVYTRPHNHSLRVNPSTVLSVKELVRNWSNSGAVGQGGKTLLKDRS